MERESDEVIVGESQRTETGLLKGYGASGRNLKRQSI